MRSAEEIVREFLMDCVMPGRWSPKQWAVLTSALQSVAWAEAAFDRLVETGEAGLGSSSAEASQGRAEREVPAPETGDRGGGDLAASPRPEHRRMRPG